MMQSLGVFTAIVIGLCSSRSFDELGPKPQEQTSVDIYCSRSDLKEIGGSIWYWN